MKHQHDAPQDSGHKRPMELFLILFVFVMSIVAFVRMVVEYIDLCAELAPLSFVGQ